MPYYSSHCEYCGRINLGTSGCEGCGAPVRAKIQMRYDEHYGNNARDYTDSYSCTAAYTTALPRTR